MVDKISVIPIQHFRAAGGAEIFSPKDLILVSENYATQLNFELSTRYKVSVIPIQHFWAAGGPEIFSPKDVILLSENYATQLNFELSTRYKVSVIPIQHSRLLESSSFWLKILLCCWSIYIFGFQQLNSAATKNDNSYKSSDFSRSELSWWLESGRIERVKSDKDCPSIPPNHNRVRFATVVTPQPKGESEAADWTVEWRDLKELCCISKNK